jgi:hypothetical protein
MKVLVERRLLTAAHRLCKRWQGIRKGTKVFATTDSGKVIKTVTSSGPWVFNDRALIRLERIHRGHPLQQVKLRGRPRIFRPAPVGAEWRILAHGRLQTIDYRSWDYQLRDEMQAPGASLNRRTIFDELVVKLGNEFLHLEQMDERTWCLIIGEEKRMLWVDRDGRVRIGEMYR